MNKFITSLGYSSFRTALKSLLVATLLVGLGLTMGWAGNVASQGYYGAKNKVLDWLIAEDLMTRIIPIDGKGNVGKLEDLTRDELVKALYLCASRQDDLSSRLQTIGEFTKD